MLFYDIYISGEGEIMDTVYGRNQKIKGRMQNNFDLDYAFLEKALENS